MKKLTNKAFTLVELIIVVVIIGILAAALLPRLTGAQGSARDSARQAHLRDISTAVSQYAAQRGELPVANWAEGKVDGNLSGVVEAGYISDLPIDPQKNSTFSGFAGQPTSGYQFKVLSKNGIQNVAVALMARAETQGGANYVQTGSIGASVESIILCDKVTKEPNKTESNLGTCEFSNNSQLRYIVIVQ